MRTVAAFTLAAALVAMSTSDAIAQVQMPTGKEMSGRVLPVPDIPVGTVTVHVARGGPENNAPSMVDLSVPGA